MLCADRLGPDLRRAEVDGIAGDAHARHEVRPDPDYRHGEVASSELLERLRVGAVGLDERNPSGPLRDALGRLLDGKNVLAEPVERAGDRRPEPPEPYHEHAGVLLGGAGYLGRPRVVSQ